jgi:ketosteroid isomerase-like protein
MPTHYEIAEGLRAGFAAGPASSVAAVHAVLRDGGSFEVRHVPPAPDDGTVSKEQFLAYGTGHTESSDAAAFRWEDVQTEVDGDEVVLTYVFVGARSDGEPVRAPARLVWTIEDGCIVRLIVYVDRAALRDAPG